MSRAGKATPVTLAKPTSVMGAIIKAPLRLKFPLEKRQRRQKNQQKRITQSKVRRRKPHGR